MLYPTLYHRFRRQREDLNPAIEFAAEPTPFLRWWDNLLPIGYGAIKLGEKLRWGNYLYHRIIYPGCIRFYHRMGPSKVLAWNHR